MVMGKGEEAILNDIADHGSALLSSPLPPSAWRSLYATFDEFCQKVADDSRHHTVFDEVASEWRGRVGREFSGYFSPYYRDRVAEKGKDNKKIIQSCVPYHEYLWRNRPDLMEVPVFRRMFDGLTAALATSYMTIVPLVRALVKRDDRLKERLFAGGHLPPVAIRLLSYSQDDGRWATQRHVDKSAITVILHTDDPLNDQRLLVYRPNGGGMLQERERSEEKARVFYGAALQEAGYDQYRPAVHAVRGLGTQETRHSAIFFWLLRGIDLSEFDTTA